MGGEESTSYSRQARPDLMHIMLTAEFRRKESGYARLVRAEEWKGSGLSESLLLGRNCMV